MALSLKTLIKIGLVSVTGAAIAVPITLFQGSGVNSLDIESPLVSAEDSTEKSHEGSSLVDSSRLSNTSINREQQVSPSVTVDTISTPDLVRPVPSIKKEEVNKRCFVIPAKSNNGSQLLTCLEVEGDVTSDNEYEEYDSSYYLYDSAKENQWSKIEGQLMWNPRNSQISVKLEKIARNRNSDTVDGVFVAEGDKWGGISNDETNLLTQCALFGNSFEGASKGITHILVCGKDSEDISQETSKGIPLILWQLSK